MKIGLDKSGTALERIIAYKFGYGPITSSQLARDLLKDDFPNAVPPITTIGQAIKYLDFVYGEAMKSRGDARS